MIHTWGHWQSFLICFFFVFRQNKKLNVVNFVHCKKYSVPLEPHCLPTHVVPVAQFAFSMQVDGWQIPPRQAVFGGKQFVSVEQLRATITNMCRYPSKWTRIPHFSYWHLNIFSDKPLSGFRLINQSVQMSRKRAEKCTKNIS